MYRMVFSVLFMCFACQNVTAQTERCTRAIYTCSEDKLKIELISTSGKSSVKEFFLPVPKSCARQVILLNQMRSRIFNLITISICDFYYSHQLQLNIDGTFGADTRREEPNSNESYLNSCVDKAEEMNKQPLTPVES